MSAGTLNSTSYTAFIYRMRHEYEALSEDEAIAHAEELAQEYGLRVLVLQGKRKVATILPERGF